MQLPCQPQLVQLAKPACPADLSELVLLDVDLSELEPRAS